MVSKNHYETEFKAVVRCKLLLLSGDATEMNYGQAEVRKAEETPLY